MLQPRLHAVLLCLAITISSHSLAQSSSSVLSHLESCALFKAAAETDLQNLRNLLQLSQHLDRRIREVGDTLARKIKPDDTPEWRFAYNTTLTREELEKELGSQKGRREKIQALITRVLTTIQGATNSGPLDIEKYKHCFIRQLNANLFPGRPKVSFLLQFFRRPKAVNLVVEPLLKCSKEVPMELLVNIDHPEGGELWINATYQYNGFVVPVFSPNLHEIRAYNRIGAMARGQYLVLLQDDQVPHADCQWIKDMVAVFNKYPKIGVIGMNAYRYVIHEGNKYGGAQLMEPELNVRMDYVELADFGPFAVRKTVFHELGGLDEGMSEPGQCGIWSDWEMCMRTWLSGYHVAHVFANRGGDGDAGGTHRNIGVATQCWGKQQGLSSGVFGQRYPDAVHMEIFKSVKELNKNLTGGDKCIYDPKHC